MTDLDIKKELEAALSKLDSNFGVRGFLGYDDQVYPLSSDTKVLSTVFEIFVRPIILEISTRHNMIVEESPQNIYPDFTLYNNINSKNKIAIDVKTTYRRPNISYTLGSYTSFLRNNTKSILYPYSDYSKHWVVGFVYDRLEGLKLSASYSLKERNHAISPITNINWFVQEKYRISGERPGSGNTANIGSIKSINLEDFSLGRGPFAKHGEAVFRDYWANYGTTAKTRNYDNIQDYFKWKQSIQHQKKQTT